VVAQAPGLDGAHPTLPAMNFQDELELLIRARYPILYVISGEETRVQSAINDVGRQAPQEGL
jgi:hypothetical protein